MAKAKNERKMSMKGGWAQVCVFCMTVGIGRMCTLVGTRLFFDKFFRVV